MATEIGSLYAKIGVDLSGLSAGLNTVKTEMHNAANTMAGTGSKIQGELDGVGKKAQVTGSLFGSLGKGILSVAGGMVAFAAAQGGLSAIQDTITAGSDLAESQSKVNVVFGESAGIINKFAASAANSLGQSTQQALEAAGTFGNLFTAMGMGQRDAAGLSTKIVGLASDLASFNNIRPEEALEKLRAGLVGESEPLRTLGINISDAAMEQEALRIGINKTSKQMTDAEKIQARYSLIMRQSTNAQGDFARTSDGLANKQRILSARFQDLHGKVGGALVPAITVALDVFMKIGDVVGSTLGPALGRLGETIGKLWDRTEPVRRLFGDLIGVFADVQNAGLNFHVALEKMVGPDIANGIVGLVKGAKELADVVGSKVKDAAQWAGDKWNTVLVPAFNDVGKYTQETLIPRLKELASEGLDKVKDAAQWAGDKWNTVLVPAFTEAFKYVQGTLLPEMKKLAEDGLSKINSGARDAAETWDTKLLPALKGVGDYLVNTLGPELVTQTSEKLANFRAQTQLTADAWNNDLKPALEKVWDFLGNDLGPMFDAFYGVKMAAADKATIAQAGLQENVLLPAYKKVWSFLGDQLGLRIDYFNTEMLPGFQRAWEGIADLFNGALGAAFSNFQKEKVDTLTKHLEDLRSIVGWITDRLNDLQGAIRGITLPDWLTPSAEQGSGGTSMRGGLAQYAKGGIVPGPIGAPQFAIVHGGERITPVGKAEPTVININANVQNAADAEALAYRVARIISARGAR